MDVGSTTLKCVAIDDNNNIVYKAYERHFSKIAEKSAEMLSDIVKKNPEFAKQEEIPFYTKDGGHGMLFKTFEGKLKLVMHQPNGDPYERPRIFDITETEDGIKFAE